MPFSQQPRAHPGRIEYENQVGPGIIQELVACLEDVSWFVVEIALLDSSAQNARFGAPTQARGVGAEPRIHGCSSKVREIGRCGAISDH